jgi:hypothetical protein
MRELQEKPRVSSMPLLGAHAPEGLPHRLLLDRIAREVTGRSIVIPGKSARQTVVSDLKT